MIGFRRARFLAGAAIAASLAGCGAPVHHSARVLQDRLQAQLAPELADHKVALQPTPDGAVVSFDQDTFFSPGQSELTPEGRFAMASFAESLLDPRLMQVAVGASTTTPDLLQEQRADAIRQYVEAFSLGPPLPMNAGGPAAPAGVPQALAITVTVHCPPGPQGSTWKYQVAGPTCN